MSDIAVRESHGFGEGESAAPKPLKKVDWAEGEEAQARKIFSQVDKDGDRVVSIRELIIALRKDPKISETLNLPNTVRQEDGTREELEMFFQALDADGDRFLTFNEFSQFFAANKEALAVVSAAPEPKKKQEVKMLPEPAKFEQAKKESPAKAPSLKKQLSRMLSKASRDPHLNKVLLIVAKTAGSPVFLFL